MEQKEHSPRRRRPQSLVANFHHLVWATHRRQPLLTAAWERLVYRCIEAQVQRLHSTVLAINGMPDHVHLVVRLHATVSCARLANQVKGVCAALVNAQRAPGTDHFGWQDGYACFSLCRAALPRVVAYVEKQKEHHAHEQIWAAWEQLPPDQDIDEP